MRIFEGTNGYITEYGIKLTHDCSTMSNGWDVNFGDVTLDWFPDAADARKFMKAFAYTNFEVVKGQ